MRASLMRFEQLQTPIQQGILRRTAGNLTRAIFGDPLGVEARDVARDAEDKLRVQELRLLTEIDNVSAQTDCTVRLGSVESHPDFFVDMTPRSQTKPTIL